MAPPPPHSSLGLAVLRWWAGPFVAVTHACPCQLAHQGLDLPCWLIARTLLNQIAVCLQHKVGRLHRDGHTSHVKETHTLLPQSLVITQSASGEEAALSTHIGQADLQTPYTSTVGCNNSTRTGLARERDSPLHSCTALLWRSLPPCPHAPATPNPTPAEIGLSGRLDGTYEQRTHATWSRKWRICVRCLRGRPPLGWGVAFLTSSAHRGSFASRV